MEQIFQILNDLDIPYELQEHKAIFSEKDPKDVVITLEGTDVKNLFVKDKNSNYGLVSLDCIKGQIVLNTNVILMITTYDITKPAINYAFEVMSKTNLCILFLNGEDLKKIVGNPLLLREIHNKQIKFIKNKIKQKF